MSYTIEYLPNKQIVLTKIKGRLNFKTVEQYSKEALKLARQVECSRYLFDHSKTTLDNGINKIHADGDELQQFGFLNTDRIAIVITDQGNDSDLLDPDSKNTNWSTIKYFYASQMKEAISWLSK